MGFSNKSFQKSPNSKEIYWYGFCLIMIKKGNDMTLVPIIYTSLLIFSTFLLFVISVSYISYKTKSYGKRKKIIGEAPKPSFVMAVQNPTMHFANNRNVNLQVRTPLPISVNNNLTYKNRTPIKVEKRSLEKNNPVQQFQNKKINYERRYNNSRNNPNFISRNEQPKSNRKSRIEIVNKTQNFPNRFENPGLQKESLPQYGPNLAEMNLLNYYSDNSEINMVTLSATKSA